MFKSIKEALNSQSFYSRTTDWHTCWAQAPFIKEVTTKLETFIASEDQSFEIDRCNAFQRRLIYQVAKAGLSQHKFKWSDSSWWRKELSQSKDIEASKKLLKTGWDWDTPDAEEMFGFSKVIKTISESKKLVGRSTWCWTSATPLNQFCAPLPRRLCWLKDMTATVFPIYWY